MNDKHIQNVVLMTFGRSKCNFIDDKRPFPFHRQSYYTVGFAKNGNFVIAVFGINYWWSETALLLPFPHERCKRNQLFFPFFEPLKYLSMTTWSMEIVVKIVSHDFTCRTISVAMEEQLARNGFDKKRRGLHSEDCCQQTRFFARGKSDQRFIVFRMGGFVWDGVYMILSSWGLGSRSYGM